ncbi:hypothetical protein RVY14_000438 [Enterobacter cloacae]|nr:hypothetical protein [Enterobacter cloacae]
MPIFIVFIISFSIWCLNILGIESWFLNITFMFSWFLIILLYIKNKKEESALNIIMIYSMSVGIICCAIVESGAYLSEIRMFGKLSGATVRVGFTALTFLLSAIIFTAILNKKIQPIYTMDRIVNKTLNSAIQLIMIGSFIGLAFLYIKYGTPNSNSIDRFEYWDTIAPSWGRYLQFMLLQFSFLLGIKYTETKHKKYVMLLIASIFMQFIGGEKFTGPSLSILFFMIPIMYHSRNDLVTLLFKPKILVFVLIVLMIFILSTYLSYSAIYGNSSDGIRYLLERIALQAQVWWAIDSVSEPVNPDLSLMWVLHNAFGVESDNGIYGMYYLMQQITPSDVFNRFLENGVRFTMGAPANYNFFFGNALGPIAAIFFGFVAGFGAWLMRNSIIMRDLFFAFIVIKYYYFIIQISIMSDWYYFFTAKFIVFTLFIIFYCCVIQRVNFKKWITI